jgi:LPXTG-site transpeptidase (sortase) family protein
MKKIILIIIVFILTFTNYYKVYKTDNIDNINLISIDKINLEQNVFSYKESNVNKNIIYLKESNLENNFYILAAHSGNSKIAYFKNLYKLEKNDIVNLVINNKKLNFIVEDIYYVKKNGNIAVPKNLKNVLYLTTCDRFNNKRQLVIKCVNKV